jgi:putative transposase
MSSTHLSLHYHIVFSTRYRISWIMDPWRKRLHAYLGGIARGLHGVPEEIGGTADHVHLLLGLNASHRLADVMRDLKADSSKWVHGEIGSAGFGWQDGYGAFTVSASDVGSIRIYIQNQEEHHRKMGFQEEYRAMLDEYGIEFDERYLW